jgi:hypothetical protein
MGKYDALSDRSLLVRINEQLDEQAQETENIERAGIRRENIAGLSFFGAVTLAELPVILGGQLPAYSLLEIVHIILFSLGIAGVVEYSESLKR